MDESVPQRTRGQALAVTLAILLSALGSVVTAGVADAAQSSGGGSIVFVKDDDLWLTTPDGATQRRLTTDGATDTADLTGSNGYDSPTQSDDGQVIVAVRIEGRTGDLFRADGYLWVLNRQGQLIRKFKPPQGVRSGSTLCSDLVVAPRGIVDAAVSPDGSKVAYVTQSNFHHPDCPRVVEHTQLWVVDIDGTDPVEIRLGSGFSDLEGPSWLTNSRLLMNRLANNRTFFVDLPGTAATDWAWGGGEPDLKAGKLASRGLDSEFDKALFLLTSSGPPAEPTLVCRYDGAAGGGDAAFAAPSWAPDASALAWEEGDGVADESGEGVYVMTVGNIAAGPSACPAASTKRLLVAGGRQPDWGPAPVTPVTTTGGRYSALTPARILDTRNGTGGISGPIGPGASVDVQVTGKGGVPATGVSAVAMNVTVTSPTATGFLTLSPASVPRPLAANLNFTPGKTVPNLVVVKVGAGGKVALFNSAGSSHVIFDVAGWFGDVPAGNDGRFQALTPARILDTRTGAGGGVRLGPGASLEVQVTNQGGVPASGAGAAVLNVAVTGTTDVSFLTVFPTGAPRPLAANLNFVAGDTVSNRVMAKLGAGGKLTIYNNAGSTDVVVDVNGWYTDASVTGTSGTYTPLVPARILDTRDGTGGVSGARPANSSVDVQITGQGGVPNTGVSAVILNVTVTQPVAGGFLTISPAGAPRPLASDLNFANGETRPNLVVVKLGAGGKVSLFTSAGTHAVFDVAGWMS